MTVTGLGIIYLKQRDWHHSQNGAYKHFIISLLSLQFCNPTGVPAPSVPLKGWHILSRGDEFLVQMQSLPRRNGLEKVSTFPH